MQSIYRRTQLVHTRAERHTWPPNSAEELMHSGLLTQPLGFKALCYALTALLERDLCTVDDMQS